MADHSQVSKSDFLLAEQLPLQILLVEDTIVNQKFALLVLKKIGYQPDIAVKGSEMLSALKLGCYDIMLADIRLLETHEIEIAHHICQEWEPGKRPYIIVMNSGSRQVNHLHGLEMFVDDTINKPIVTEELVQALSKYKNRVSLSPAIDFATLQYLRLMLGEDEVAFREVISCYLAESPQLLQVMSTSVTNEDALTLSQTAHKFKSSSASLGAKILTRLCLQLEIKGESSNLEGSRNIILQLEQEYEQVKAALEKIKN